MKAIDRAKSHFNSLEIKKIKVPEWDMDIYARPLNLFKRQQSYIEIWLDDDSIDYVSLCS
jgi:hypothetical protein